MADRTVGTLPQATVIGENDYLLIEQGGVTKCLTGATLSGFIDREIVDIDVTTVAYNATPTSTYDRSNHKLHMQVQRGPGIKRIDGPSTSGLTDTYSVITQDDQVAGTFSVTNGAGTVNKVMGLSPTGPDNDVTQNALMNLIYPVGSIYLSVRNVNPGTLFGGTWERLKGPNDSTSGFVLVSCGTGYSAGSTGGEATVTLTKAQMPEHNHSAPTSGTRAYISGQLGYPDSGGSQDAYTVSGWGKAHTATTSPITQIAVQSEGGGEAHNNMPPYLAVYMWKRKA